MVASSPPIEEQNFHSLLKVWMKLLMSYSVAEKGVLVIQDSHHLRILAQGKISDGRLEINTDQGVIHDDNDFPASIVRDVIDNPRELIAETAIPSPYLCFPVILKDQKLGAVYLENLPDNPPLSSDRSELIRLMCSQAALLICNLHIFENLKNSAHREAETAKLWEEIKRRRKSEMKLEQAQRQLIQILDTSNEAIIAFNHDYKITFFNRKAEVLFGYTFQELSGHSISHIFPELEEELRSEQFGMRGKLTPSSIYPFPYRYLVKSGELDGESLHLAIAPLKGESGYVLTVEDPSSPHPPTSNTLKQWEDTFSTLIELIVRDQPQLLNQFRPLPQNLDQILDMPAKEDSSKPLREVLVEIMNLSLSYWGLTTQGSKGDLAEKSKIWHATVDSLGAFRTRTLDRYLRLETIPQNPNWRNVFLTAQFVMQYCPDTAPDLKEELKKYLEKAKSLI